MSHIVSIKTQVRDPAAISAACRRLNVPEPQQGTAELFEGPVTGLLLMLPEWRYPAVIDIAKGEVRFDTFEGHWGDRAHLDRFLQAYAVERAKLEARRRGCLVQEQTLADGSIQLRIAEAA
ncbi:MAG: hypothetical protein K2X38_24025 [Gemmataceae bacterium]|nr:hypothetical protein [Gemmataceae bacterium]